MKIVSVMTTAYRGGAEFSAVALLDALAARGHETVMLSDLPGIGRDTRVRVRPLAIGPKLTRRSVPQLAAAAPVLLARLRRALEREAPYDVLLLHFKKEQLLAAALPVRLRPRLAWAEWGRLPAPLRQGPANRLYRRAARDVDAVLAVSSGTARSLVDAGIDERLVHVVPNVVSADEIRYDRLAGRTFRDHHGIPERAFVVGCMSRFHANKPNEVAVDAAMMAADDADAPPLHLVMAGEGETEAALRARAAPLGDRAHFVPTPGTRVVPFLSACDVVVFCPARTEGAPLAVITAMLAERPCVATGAEGVTDLLAPGTGAIATPEHDVPAVAELIRAYRDDPARATREGAAARRRAAAMHDPQAIARRVEGLLGGATSR
jgi:glycosyltransferase involved in cell wall biosynthesis